MKSNFQSTQYWRIKLKKKSVKKRKKNDPSQPELTYQTYDLSHEIGITSYKAIKKKKQYDSDQVNPPNSWPGSWNWDKLKQSKQKKKPKATQVNLPNPQLGSTYQTHDLGHEVEITL
jgi:hypothetical protein